VLNYNTPKEVFENELNKFDSGELKVKGGAIQT